MRNRETRAIEVLVAALDDLGVEGSIRVAGIGTADVCHALGEQADAALAWERGAGGTPWPGDEPTDHAVLRLPKGREAFRMALHALAARVRPGGRIFVYGANDEGVRSAGKTLSEVSSDVITLDARRHCRVWAGRVGGSEGLRGELAEWAVACTAPTAMGPVDWVSYPGLFAHGHLDPATELLLEALHGASLGRHVLDYGCGSGVIAAALRTASPELELHGIDVDPLALAATKENVDNIETTAGERLDVLQEGVRFDAIVSNPPIHIGKDQDYDIVEALCTDAGARLRAHGSLWIVTQRPIPVGRWLEGRFAEIHVRAEDRSFIVWSAQHPVQTRRRR